MLNDGALVVARVWTHRLADRQRAQALGSYQFLWANAVYLVGSILELLSGEMCNEELDESTFAWTFAYMTALSIGYGMLVGSYPQTWKARLFVFVCVVVSLLAAPTLASCATNENGGLARRNAPLILGVLLGLGMYRRWGSKCSNGPSVPCAIF